MRRSKIKCIILVCVSAIGGFLSASIMAIELDKVKAYFSHATVVSGPKLVDCTLSGGTKTECFQITLNPNPTSYTPGPWCPKSISDYASEGGIWLDSNEVHDVDGSFIEAMADFYSDPNWQLYDEDTGKVFVTDTLEKCAGAAKPDVEEQYRQHCVECQIDYLDAGTTVTYTIPMESKVAAQPSPTGRTGSGVAFNGVRLDGPAPVADILGNYTIAPFDDCGGHVNLNVGYHYHAATDCLDDTASETEHGSVVGVAMDGYLIYENASDKHESHEAQDQCGGHETEKLAYHYHAGDQGSNAILSCLSGEYGCLSSKPNAACDASSSSRPAREGKGRRSKGARPDFSAASKKLGVTEGELKRALGGPPPNFDKAAKTLGVTVEQLKDAIGRPGGPK